MRSCWLTSRWTVPVWAKALPQKRAAAMAVNLSFISRSLCGGAPCQLTRLAAACTRGPIRHSLAGQRNVTVLMGEARSVDAARRAVVLEDGSELPSDKLIVATGSINNYFGNDRWAPFAPALKTLDDALEIRGRILLAFERAE